MHVWTKQRTPTYYLLFWLHSLEKTINMGINILTKESFLEQRIFECFDYTLVFCHGSNNDFHTIVAGLDDVFSDRCGGYAHICRSDIADIWQDKVRNEIIALLTV